MTSNDQNVQFNKLYKTRFNNIQPFIKTESKIPICKSLFEVNKHKDEVFIIGTLFVASDLKQTIFYKINKNPNSEKISSNTYCSSEIRYFIEDDTGKVELQFDNLDELITTGMVLGFRGKHVDSVFKVYEIVFPEAIKSEPKKFDGKIAFISNLLVDQDNNLVHLKIIFDYLTIKNIETVVLVGNYFEKDFNLFKNFIDNGKLNLILLPEYKDFECTTFPLSSIHPKLFDVNSISHNNPSIFNISNLTFGITSSFIIRDLLKYIPQELEGIQSHPDTYRMHLEENKIENVQTENKFENSDNIIKGLLALIKARHLCPNAPDTVPCTPFSKSDEFFIDSPLDFLIVKDDDFKISKCHKTNTTVFTIPDFAKSKEIVILDGMNCTPLKLDVDSLN
jgi:DNA polymerase delta subunit 2